MPGTAAIANAIFDATGVRFREPPFTPERVRAITAPCFDSPVLRYEVPGLNALKFVFPQALPSGVYASMHAGLHWQKAAIWLLLDHRMPPLTGDSDASVG